MKAFAEKEYREALQRLIDRGEHISLNKVALEAGKKSGSLREKRYPEVCKEVKQAIIDQEHKAKTKSKPKAKKKNKDELIDQLEQRLRDMNARNAVLSSRIISLENQLFEATKELEEFRAGNIDNPDKKVSKIIEHL